MESIYRDAYPDVFATFEDDYESVKADIKMQRLDDTDKEDAPNVETI